ncbi:MAG TPA: hypothetical protein VKE41_11150 [Roseiflexaceae bacterium]|nr:hypothetical protein [Roseiflexaceae bacterium]
MLDIHTLAIVIHALSATGAFVVGVVLLLQTNALRQLQLGTAFVVLLVLLELFLVIAIVSHVTSLPTLTQIIFGGLAILGVYMIWRAVHAMSVMRAQPGNQAAIIDDN